jgi:hypothetical protein
MPEQRVLKTNEKVSSLIAEVPFYKSNVVETKISPTTYSTKLHAEKILNTKEEEITTDSRYTALPETIDKSPVTTGTVIGEKVIVAQQPTTEPQESKTTNSNSEKEISSNRTNVTFSVTILPVRFVYVENGQIVKIWNNTTENDTEYVLKFLDYESNEELVETEQLTIAYFEAIQGIDVFEQGVIFERTSTTFVDNTRSSEVQFNYTATGVEEVHTFI